MPSLTSFAYTTALSTESSCSTSPALDDFSLTFSNTTFCAASFTSVVEILPLIPISAPTGRSSCICGIWTTGLARLPCCCTCCCFRRFWLCCCCCWTLSLCLWHCSFGGKCTLFCPCRRLGGCWRLFRLPYASSWPPPAVALCPLIKYFSWHMGVRRITDVLLPWWRWNGSIPMWLVWLPPHLGLVMSIVPDLWNGARFTSLWYNWWVPTHTIPGSGFEQTVMKTVCDHRGSWVLCKISSWHWVKSRCFSKCTLLSAFGFGDLPTYYVPLSGLPGGDNDPIASTVPLGTACGVASSARADIFTAGPSPVMKCTSRTLIIRIPSWRVVATSRLTWFCPGFLLFKCEHFCLCRVSSCHCRFMVMSDPTPFLATITRFAGRSTVTLPNPSPHSPAIISSTKQIHQAFNNLLTPVKKKALEFVIKEEQAVNIKEFDSQLD